MGLHSASDGGGNPNEEEEEEDGRRQPETTGQGPPHTGEEPIKCLPAGQDFQHQQIGVMLNWLSDRTVVVTICSHRNEMVYPSLRSVMS